MKKAVFFIYIIVLHSMITHAQSPADKASIDSRNDLSSLLKPGTHIANVYDKPVLTPAQKALIAKIEKAITQMGDSGYTGKEKDSTAVPTPEDYMAKLGITKEEMEEYSKIYPSRLKVVVIGKDTLTIIKNGDRIRFKGSRTNTLLDSLELNLATNTARYKNQLLTYKGFSEEKSDKNPFHSGFSSYQFSFREMNKPAGDPLLHPSRPTSMIELIIGRVKNTGKPFLGFSAFKSGGDVPGARNGSGIILVFE